MKRLDESEYDFKIPESRKRKPTNSSKQHLRARKLLQEMFPGLNFYEEVPIQIYIKKTLTLDFFIPTLYTAIEVQGEQHYKFNAFHYRNQIDFLKAQSNDRYKRDWCELNNIRLVELPYNLKDEEWTLLIQP